MLLTVIFVVCKFSTCMTSQLCSVFLIHIYLLAFLFVTSKQEESSKLMQHIENFFETLSDSPCENDG